MQNYISWNPGTSGILFNWTHELPLLIFQFENLYSLDATSKSPHSGSLLYVVAIHIVQNNTAIMHVVYPLFSTSWCRDAIFRGKQDLVVVHLLKQYNSGKDMAILICGLNQPNWFDIYEKFL